MISKYKKSIILGLLLILVLLLVIFFVYFTKKNKKINYDNSQKFDIIDKLQKSTSTTFYFANKTENKISKIEPLFHREQNSKLINIFYLNKNLNGCVLLKDISKRDKCILNIVESLNLEEELDKIDICFRVVNKKKREECFNMLAKNANDINVQNVICNKFDDKFEKKECLDRNYQYIITKNKGNIDVNNIANRCLSSLLEYKILCLQRLFREIGYNCDLFNNKLTKDYCITYKIKADITQKGYENIEDCNRMPLDIYRKVCLLEVENSEIKLDTDQDGLVNRSELFFDTDPFNSDTDGDGLSDYDEIKKYGLNPKDKDSDGDGISDKEEVENINKPNITPNDSDGDGLLDEEEELWHTNKNKYDTDGDGINDKEEIENGTNPNSPDNTDYNYDTDGDGLIDVDEIFYLTDRLNPDTDGDGISDYEEIKNLTNPLGNGVLNLNYYFDKEENIDSDGDKLIDGFEDAFGLNKISADSDNDGLNDYDELVLYATDPLNPDTDKDGYMDGEEVKNGYNPKGSGKLNEF